MSKYMGRVSRIKYLKDARLHIYIRYDAANNLLSGSRYAW